MATTLVGALWERLVTDATVRSLVSTYTGGPAVFAIEPVPQGATRPLIAIGQPIDEQRFDTKTTRGYEHRRDVYVFTDAVGTAGGLETLVAAVKRALHRRPISWAGVRGVICEVTRDADIPNDGTIYARAVTVRLVVEEV